MNIYLVEDLLQNKKSFNTHLEFLETQVSNHQNQQIRLVLLEHILMQLSQGLYLRTVGKNNTVIEFKEKFISLKG